VWRVPLDALPKGTENSWFYTGMGLPTHNPPEAPKKDEPPWKRRRAAAAQNN
jgi:hypothetical protein